MSIFGTHFDKDPEEYDKPIIGRNWKMIMMIMMIMITLLCIVVMIMKKMMTMINLS